MSTADIPQMVLMIVLTATADSLYGVYLTLKPYFLIEIITLAHVSFSFLDYCTQLDVDEETLSLIVKGLKQPLGYDIRQGESFN